MLNSSTSSEDRKLLPDVEVVRNTLSCALRVTAGPIPTNEKLACLDDELDLNSVNTRLVQEKDDGFPFNSRLCC